ncbi:MAG: antibiotic biosynthesis monooxygenase [Hyphomonadaceae bacterium]|nr:antibiotic biosynthesis monooxygenase [Hyphomonadaceae bacterium]
MFAVLYRWRIRPEREALFEESWRRGTLAIRRDLGGWGSRLHRAEDGSYIAYAVWPDEETWRTAKDGRMPYNDPATRAMYTEAMQGGSLEVLERLVVLDDLLLGPSESEA